MTYRTELLEPYWTQSDELTESAMPPSPERRKLKRPLLTASELANASEPSFADKTEEIWDRLTAAIHKRTKAERLRLGIAMAVIGFLVAASLVYWQFAIDVRAGHDHTSIGVIQKVLRQEASCPQYGASAPKCSALLMREVNSLSAQQRADIRALFGG